MDRASSNCRRTTAHTLLILCWSYLVRPASQLSRFHDASAYFPRHERPQARAREPVLHLRSLPQLRGWRAVRCVRPRARLCCGAPRTHRGRFPHGGGARLPLPGLVRPRVALRAAESHGHQAHPQRAPTAAHRAHASQQHARTHARPLGQRRRCVAWRVEEVWRIVGDCGWLALPLAPLLRLTPPSTHRRCPTVRTCTATRSRITRRARSRRRPRRCPWASVSPSSVRAEHAPGGRARVHARPAGWKPALSALHLFCSPKSARSTHCRRVARRG